MPEETIDKRNLSERDICSKFITPALLAAGWRPGQIREEVPIVPGRIQVRGKLTSREMPKRADYVLYYKPNLPLAVIEAKDNNHALGAGMQQGLGYAEMLDAPFVYASNGDGFLEHTRGLATAGVEQELALDSFPSPQQLWERYQQQRGLTPEQTALVTQDYYQDGSGRLPRYYQTVAVNRAIDAVASGQDRILLVMATGTGKTYTAFQIIYRLWKSRRKKRILFLADRNILIDQTMIGDFKHFGSTMTKIQGRKIDKSYEVYLALYQGISGNEDWKNSYKEFSPDFFDLVIVDECHRGSAREDSAWREILEYFSAATQVGLTATPAETKDVSNSHYFGEPIYNYSLKQGIQDGFLAPYKVVRIATTVDADGWTPSAGQRDKYGYEIDSRYYSSKDFERNIVIDERTQLVADKVSDFLKGTDRFSKTIVFCVDIEHAERMRQALVKANADLVAQHPKYIMRITGDSDEGKRELDPFLDPKQKLPVIVTTSKLLTTGVDAQTCKLIVLDANIGSMTEFKQIIGRGTRLREDYGKQFFTIMDFRDVTRKFNDPDFDGDPVQIYAPGDGDTVVPPDDTMDDPPGAYPILDLPEDGGSGIGEEKPRKYHVNQVPVSIAYERVQYLGKDGKLITTSLWDYTRQNICLHYATLDDFLRRWNSEAKKQRILEELAEQGVLFAELQEIVGQDLDPFDLVCHVAFDQPKLTRRERAERVKQRNYFGKYGEQARAVLAALLDKYASAGVGELENLSTLEVDPLSRYGTKSEIVNHIFGGKATYDSAVDELKDELYKQAN